MLSVLFLIQKAKCHIIALLLWVEFYCLKTLWRWLRTVLVTWPQKHMYYHTHLCCHGNLTTNNFWYHIIEQSPLNHPNKYEDETIKYEDVIPTFVSIHKTECFWQEDRQLLKTEHYHSIINVKSHDRVQPILYTIIYTLCMPAHSRMGWVDCTWGERSIFDCIYFTIHTLLAATASIIE